MLSASRQKNISNWHARRFFAFFNDAQKRPLDKDPFMLQAFREHKRWLMVIAMVFIIPSFVVTGILFVQPHDSE